MRLSTLRNEMMKMVSPDTNAGKTDVVSKSAQSLHLIKLRCLTNSPTMAPQNTANKKRKPDVGSKTTAAAKKHFKKAPPMKAHIEMSTAVSACNDISTMLGSDEKAPHCQKMTSCANLAIELCGYQPWDVALPMNRNEILKLNKELIENNWKPLDFKITDGMFQGTMRNNVKELWHTYEKTQMRQHGSRNALGERPVKPPSWDTVQRHWSQYAKVCRHVWMTNVTLSKKEAAELGNRIVHLSIPTENTYLRSFFPRYTSSVRFEMALDSLKLFEANHLSGTITADQADRSIKHLSGILCHLGRPSKGQPRQIYERLKDWYDKISNEEFKDNQMATTVEDGLHVPKSRFAWIESLVLDETHAEKAKREADERKEARKLQREENKKAKTVTTTVGASGEGGMSDTNKDEADKASVPGEAKEGDKVCTTTVGASGEGGMSDTNKDEADKPSVVGEAKEGDKVSTMAPEDSTEGNKSPPIVEELKETPSTDLASDDSPDDKEKSAKSEEGTESTTEESSKDKSSVDKAAETSLAVPALEDTTATTVSSEPDGLSLLKDAACTLLAPSLKPELATTLTKINLNKLKIRVNGRLLKQTKDATKVKEVIKIKKNMKAPSPQEMRNQLCFKDMEEVESKVTHARKTLVATFKEEPKLRVNVPEKKKGARSYVKPPKEWSAVKIFQFTAVQSLVNTLSVFYLVKCDAPAKMKAQTRVNLASSAAIKCGFIKNETKTKQEIEESIKVWIPPIMAESFIGYMCILEQMLGRKWAKAEVYVYNYKCARSAIKSGRFCEEEAKAIEMIVDMMIEISDLTS